MRDKILNYYNELDSEKKIYFKEFIREEIN